MGGGYGSSAIPLYNKFVEQAIKLEPRYITMIIPSRWMIGGKGLDKFREKMLKCNQISHIVDYLNSSDCFSGVDVNGGICYFLWEKNYQGKCNFTNIDKDESSSSFRYLLTENNDFIRFNEAIPIVEKVRNKNLKSFSDLVFYRNTFNISSNAKLPFVKYNPNLDQTKIYGFKNGKNFVEYLSPDFVIEKNEYLRDEYKIFIAKALGEANMKKRKLFLKPIKGDINTICTETYLVIGPFETEDETNNCINFMKTKFFHFLFGLKRISQNTTKDTYGFIPLLDFTKSYNDESLYKMFDLNNEEINYLESFFKE